MAQNQDFVNNFPLATPVLGIGMALGSEENENNYTTNTQQNNLASEKATTIDSDSDTELPNSFFALDLNVPQFNLVATTDESVVVTESTESATHTESTKDSKEENQYKLENLAQQDSLEEKIMVGAKATVDWIPPTELESARKQENISKQTIAQQDTALQNNSAAEQFVLVPTLEERNLEVIAKLEEYNELTKDSASYNSLVALSSLGTSHLENIAANIFAENPQGLKSFKLPELTEVKPYALVHVANELVVAKASLQSLASLIPQGLIIYTRPITPMTDDGTRAYLERFVSIYPGYKLIEYPFALIPEDNPELYSNLYRGVSRFWLGDAFWTYAWLHLKAWIESNDDLEKAWVLKTNAHTIFDPKSMASFYKFVAKKKEQYKVFPLYSLKVSQEPQLNKLWFHSCTLEANEFFAKFTAIRSFEYQFHLSGATVMHHTSATNFQNENLVCHEKYWVLGADFYLATAKTYNQEQEFANEYTVGLLLEDCNWYSAKEMIAEVYEHSEFYSQEYLAAVSKQFWQPTSVANTWAKDNFSLVALMQSEENLRPEQLTHTYNRLHAKFSSLPTSDIKQQFLVDYGVIAHLMQEQALLNVRVVSHQD